MVNKEPAVATAPALSQARLDELAGEVMQRCDALAACSADLGRITRLFCSPAMQQAHQLVRSWVAAAGLDCRLDAAGNLIARWEPKGCDPQHCILLGSHLDTVIDAGRYDGILGVACGLVLVEELHRIGASLPWAVEVVAFSEEEGVRFKTPFLGSRALAGDFEPALLDLVDAADITMRESLEHFGADPTAIPQCALRRGQAAAYLEIHIEQGPQLERAGLPLGVVMGIAGQSRLTFTWTGPGGHAGTVPMVDRADPFTAASRWALAVEEHARQTPGLVATVGRVVVEPNAPNCIPRRVETSLDIRYADDAVRRRSVDALLVAARQIAQDSRVTIEVRYDHEHSAIGMDAALTRRLEAAVAAAGEAPLSLASGAGHDAGVLAAVAPTAMLFIRCRGGVSHSPDESVMQTDVAAALAAAWQFIANIAST